MMYEGIVPRVETELLPQTLLEKAWELVGEIDELVHPSKSELHAPSEVISIADIDHDDAPMSLTFLMVGDGPGTPENPVEYWPALIEREDQADQVDYQLTPEGLLYYEPDSIEPILADDDLMQVFVSRLQVFHQLVLEHRDKVSIG
jgi:hypothetical protein